MMRPIWLIGILFWLVNSHPIRIVAAETDSPNSSATTANYSDPVTETMEPSSPVISAVAPSNPAAVTFPEANPAEDGAHRPDKDRAVAVRAIAAQAVATASEAPPLPRFLKIYDPFDAAPPSGVTTHTCSEAEWDHLLSYYHQSRQHVQTRQPVNVLLRAVFQPHRRRLAGTADWEVPRQTGNVPGVRLTPINLMVLDTFPKSNAGRNAAGAIDFWPNDNSLQTIHLDWEQFLANDDTDWTFKLQLPSCAVAELRLAVPKGWQLQVKPARVAVELWYGDQTNPRAQANWNSGSTRTHDPAPTAAPSETVKDGPIASTPPTGQQAFSPEARQTQRVSEPVKSLDATTDAPVAPPPPVLEEKEYILRFPGVEELTLTFTPDYAEQPLPPHTVLFRQQTKLTCQLTPDFFRTNGELRLRSTYSPMQTVELISTTDGPLDQWQLEPAGRLEPIQADGSSGGRWRLEFHQPTFEAKLEFTTQQVPQFDQLWPIPLLRALDGLPQQEQMTVLVHPDLTLHQLEPRTFDLEEVTLEEGYWRGRFQQPALRFGLATAQAATAPSLWVQPTASQLTFRQRLDWTVAPNKHRLDAQITWYCNQGRFHMLPLRVPAGWSILNIRHVAPPIKLSQVNQAKPLPIASPFLPNLLPSVASEESPALVGPNISSEQRLEESAQEFEVAATLTGALIDKQETLPMSEETMVWIKLPGAGLGSRQSLQLQVEAEAAAPRATTDQPLAIPVLHPGLTTSETMTVTVPAAEVHLNIDSRLRFHEEDLPTNRQEIFHPNKPQLDAADRHFVFDYLPGQTIGVVQLLPEELRYRVQHRHWIHSNGQDWVVQLRLECDLEQGEITSLPLLCSAPLPEDLQWQTEPGGIPITWQRDDQLCPPEAPAGTVGYRLQFPTLKVARMNLWTIYRLKTPQCAVPLWDAPQAVAFHGEVALWGTPTPCIDILTRNLPSNLWQRASNTHERERQPLTPQPPAYLCRHYATPALFDTASDQVPLQLQPSETPDNKWGKEQTAVPLLWWGDYGRWREGMELQFRYPQAPVPTVPSQSSDSPFSFVAGEHPAGQARLRVRSWISESEAVHACELELQSRRMQTLSLTVPESAEIRDLFLDQTAVGYTFTQQRLHLNVPLTPGTHEVQLRYAQPLLDRLGMRTVTLVDPLQLPQSSNSEVSANASVTHASTSLVTTMDPEKPNPSWQVLGRHWEIHTPRPVQLFPAWLPHWRPVPGRWQRFSLPPLPKPLANSAKPEWQQVWQRLASAWQEADNRIAETNSPSNSASGSFESSAASLPGQSTAEMDRLAQQAASWLAVADQLPPGWQLWVHGPSLVAAAQQVHQTPAVAAERSTSPHSPAVSQVAWDATATAKWADWLEQQQLQLLAEPPHLFVVSSAPPPWGFALPGQTEWTPSQATKELGVDETEQWLTTANWANRWPHLVESYRRHQANAPTLSRPLWLDASTKPVNQASYWFPSKTPNEMPRTWWSATLPAANKLSEAATPTGLMGWQVTILPASWLFWGRWLLVLCSATCFLILTHGGRRLPATGWLMAGLLGLAILACCGGASEAFLSPLLWGVVGLWFGCLLLGVPKHAEIPEDRTQWDQHPSQPPPPTARTSLLTQPLWLLPLCLTGLLCLTRSGWTQSVAPAPDTTGRATPMPPLRPTEQDTKRSFDITPTSGPPQPIGTAGRTWLGVDSALTEAGASASTNRPQPLVPIFLKQDQPADNQAWPTWSVRVEEKYWQQLRSPPQRPPLIQKLEVKGRPVQTGRPDQTKVDQIRWEATATVVIPTHWPPPPELNKIVWSNPDQWRQLHLAFRMVDVVSVQIDGTRYSDYRFDSSLLTIPMPARAGTYQVQVDFVSWMRGGLDNKEVELDFELPASPRTMLTLDLGDLGGQPLLASSLLGTEITSNNQIRGLVNPQRRVRLRWRRALPSAPMGTEATAASGTTGVIQEIQKPARLQVKSSTRLELGDSFHTAWMLLDFQTPTGAEQDRFTLLIPPQLFVLGVKADAEMRWQWSPNRSLSLAPTFTEIKPIEPPNASSVAFLELQFSEPVETAKVWVEALVAPLQPNEAAVPFCWPAQAAQVRGTLGVQHPTRWLCEDLAQAEWLQPQTVEQYRKVWESFRDSFPDMPAAPIRLARSFQQDYQTLDHTAANAGLLSSPWRLGCTTARMQLALQQEWLLNPDPEHDQVQAFAVCTLLPSDPNGALNGPAWAQLQLPIGFQVQKIAGPQVHQHYLDSQSARLLIWFKENIHQPTRLLLTGAWQFQPATPDHLAHWQKEEVAPTHNALTNAPVTKAIEVGPLQLLQSEKSVVGQAAWTVSTKTISGWRFYPLPTPDTRKLGKWQFAWQKPDRSEEPAQENGTPVALHLLAQQRPIKPVGRHYLFVQADQASIRLTGRLTCPNPESATEEEYRFQLPALLNQIHWHPMEQVSLGNRRNEFILHTSPVSGEPPVFEWHAELPRSEEWVVPVPELPIEFDWESWVVVDSSFEVMRQRLRALRGLQEKANISNDLSRWLAQQAIVTFPERLLTFQAKSHDWHLPLRLAQTQGQQEESGNSFQVRQAQVQVLQSAERETLLLLRWEVRDLAPTAVTWQIPAGFEILQMGLADELLTDWHLSSQAPAGSSSLSSFAGTDEQSQPKAAVHATTMSQPAWLRCRLPNSGAWRWLSLLGRFPADLPEALPIAHPITPSSQQPKPSWDQISPTSDQPPAPHWGLPTLWTTKQYPTFWQIKTRPDYQVELWGKTIPSVAATPTRSESSDRSESQSQNATWRLWPKSSRPMWLLARQQLLLDQMDQLLHPDSKADAAAVLTKSSLVPQVLSRMGEIRLLEAELRQLALQAGLTLEHLPHDLEKRSSTRSPNESTEKLARDRSRPIPASWQPTLSQWQDQRQQLEQILSAADAFSLWWRSRPQPAATTAAKLTPPWHWAGPGAITYYYTDQWPTVLHFRSSRLSWLADVQITPSQWFRLFITMILGVVGLSTASLRLLRLYWPVFALGLAWFSFHLTDMQVAGWFLLSLILILGVRLIWNWFEPPPLPRMAAPSET